MILVLLLPLVLLYFLPSIVALSRGRQVGVVCVVNLFFGWTFLGWVAALAFAVSAKPPTPVIVLPQFGYSPYPVSSASMVYPSAQQPYPFPPPVYPTAPQWSTQTQPLFERPPQLPPPA